MKFEKLLESYAPYLTKIGLGGFAAMIGIGIASLKKLGLTLTSALPLFFLTTFFVFIWIIGHHIEKALEKRSVSEIDEEKMSEFRKKLEARNSEDEFVDI